MSLNVAVWRLDYRQQLHKKSLFLVLFNLEESFSDLRKAPVVCQDYAKAEMFGCRGERAREQLVLERSVALAEGGHLHGSTPGLRSPISAGCCRVGPFPLECQQSERASLCPAVCQKLFP